MDFDVHVQERILKPIAEVFDAVIDHRKMSRYFITGASGPIQPGTVIWEFGDVGVKVPIDVLEVEHDRRIVLQSSALGPTIRTTIEFAPDGPGATVVTVTESKFPLTEEGVKLALGQNAGWTHTLCGLKAYVQFGIHLREGLKHRLTDV